MGIYSAKEVPIYSCLLYTSVYIAIATPWGLETEKLNITTGPITTRDTIRDYACKRALYRLWQMITKQK